jgi:uncharacterized protein (DUF2147 family)
MWLCHTIDALLCSTDLGFTQIALTQIALGFANRSDRMTVPPRQLISLAAALLMIGVTAPARAAEPTGTWLTQRSDAQIRVARCGPSMCGTVVWLRNEVDARTGQPPVDSRNPNPSMRNRKILGLRIFAMASDGNGGWAGGIYNAEDGQTYAGRLVLRDPYRLEVHGCAGPLCGSETWTRAGR